jgi:hypothetical protein
MSTLIIRKKSLKTWLHTDSILGDFIISKFYFNADNLSFQIVEQGQSRRVIYNITDITLYTLPTGGTAETFANITALSLRLEELNYPAFQYDGQITSIANLIDAGTGVTITGDGTAESPYIINSTGGGGTQTLAEVLVEGNITDGTDISISDGDKIVLDNGANLKKGTTDAGLGGTKGIALRCAVDYELKWEAGRLYVMGGDGFTIREVSHNFTTTPTVNDDDTKGFVIDSRWILDNGDVYVCTDDTTGAAVWELVNTGTTPTLQEVTDEGADAYGNTINLKNSISSDSLIQFNVDDAFEPYIKVENLAAGSAGHSTILGSSTIEFEGNGDYNTIIEAGVGVDNIVTLPSESGTLALTTDITTPTLQEVTDEGATTTNPISIPQLNLYDTAQDEYSKVSVTDRIFNVFTPTDDIIFSADILGQINWTNEDGFVENLKTTNLTATRYHELPDADGTIALTSDIPTGAGIPHATASGTDTYTATVTGVAAYTDADAYLIRFTNGNTTGATLNINSLGAKTLYRNNDGALIGGDIINGGEMLCIYNTSLNGFQVIGTAPNSLFAYVTNADSVTITKGMPVYAFSGTGDRMTVKRANNSADATSAQTVGLVLSTSIAAGQKGLIMMQGLLDGLSILPTSTFADGDAIYLGATDGTITNVKPYAPNHLVYLGVVTTASNGSAGRMYVRIQNGYELSEIHDVDLISNAPTNNQVLTYETSTDLWKNKTIIEDSITNGVTDKAPSQNAVFDALALKQNSLSYTPYRNIQTSQTPLTGTTAETVVFTATIPAGTFNSTDIIRVLFGTNKTTALGTYNLRVRVNTTNTISGSTAIALVNGGAGAAAIVIQRNFNLNGGNLYGVSFNTGAVTDIVSSGAGLSSTTLNPANQFFIFATIQLANASDSIIGNMFSIHN